MKTRSFVFTEQFFYPDGWGGAQLPRDLTTYLARTGARVEVICGSDQYVPDEGQEIEDPRACGVIIRRTPRLLGGSIHQFKLLKQLVFYAACLPLLLVRRRPDLYVTQTNPPLLVPLVALTAMLHRRPFIVIAQDIYPEVMFAHGMVRSEGLAAQVLTGLFAWAYRRAARVVALGKVMAQRLVNKGVHRERIEIISNWSTGAQAVERGMGNVLRSQWSVEGCFVILYSGNVGIAHDVETPIAALRVLLQSRPNVRLIFVGKGKRLAEAQRITEAHGVSHAVQFRPLVAASAMSHSLGLAHVALVTLLEGFEGLVVPSKLLGYMARSIPTIYVGPHSDIEQMLVESGGGMSFRNGDASGMAAALQSLIDKPESLAALGAAAGRYYDAHLARSIAMDKYASLIESSLASMRSTD